MLQYLSVFTTSHEAAPAYLVTIQRAHGHLPAGGRTDTPPKKPSIREFNDKTTEAYHHTVDVRKLNERLEELERLRRTALKKIDTLTKERNALRAQLTQAQTFALDVQRTLEQHETKLIGVIRTSTYNRLINQAADVKAVQKEAA